MATQPKEGVNLIKKTYQEFSKDDCWQMAAALAYYTVFSLPPLLLILVAIVGFVFDPADVRGEIEEQMQEMIGPEAAEQARTMIEQAGAPGQGPIGMTVGIVVLLFGATGVMVQLQQALNRAWDVQPDPAQGGVMTFIFKRIFSFAMVLVIAFLLLLSLVLSTVLSAFGGMLADFLPAGLSQPVLVGLDFVISLAIITLLFAAIFKVLPDTKIRWKEVLVGAFVTALLFVIGRYLIGIYMGTADVGSAYGAAGSLVVILVWIYYSSLILLIGAEFTQVWARRHGKPIEPTEGAVRVVQEQKKVPSEREEQQAKQPQTNPEKPQPPEKSQPPKKKET